MKKIFYEKVGRRYRPVSEYNSELFDAYPKGVHLVICNPTGRSTRFNIDPDFGPLIAAGRFAEDAISLRIMEKSGLRYSGDRKPLTEQQKQAWAALTEAFGDERYPLEYCSYREAAEEGVRAMQEEAEKMLTNPAVRRAWDNFMLIWQLAKENER